MNSPITKTLWMGDIDSFIDEEFIFNIFRNLNVSLKFVRIIRDKQTGQKQDFETREEAMLFLENYNGKQILNTNRLFKLNWAMHNPTRTNSNSSLPENISVPISTSIMSSNTPQKFMKKQKHMLEFTIYVGELDPKVSEEMLNIFFKEYQSIISVKIITDLNTKMSRGYGFIKFINYFEFQRAIKEMNGRILMHKAIKVNQAGPKRSYGETNIDNGNYSSGGGSSNNGGQGYNTNQMTSTSKPYHTKYFNNYNQNALANNSVYEFVHQTPNCSQNNFPNFNEGNRNYSTSSNYVSGYPNNGNYNSNGSTKIQSNDSFKSYDRYTSPFGQNTTHSIKEASPEEFSRSIPNSNKNYVEPFSIEKIIEAMEKNDKLLSDETSFDALGKSLAFPNFKGNFKRNLSNFYENRKCPLNNFLYYYNVIDLDKDVNFMDQFYISFSKYGHSYECINDFLVEKSESSGRQDYLLKTREGNCNKAGESFINSENSAMGIN